MKKRQFLIKKFNDNSDSDSDSDSDSSTSTSSSSSPDITDEKQSGIKPDEQQQGFTTDSVDRIIAGLQKEREKKKELQQKNDLKPVKEKPVPSIKNLSFEIKLGDEPKPIQITQEWKPETTDRIIEGFQANKEMKKALQKNQNSNNINKKRSYSMNEKSKQRVQNTYSPEFEISSQAIQRRSAARMKRDIQSKEIHEELSISDLYENVEE